MIITDAIFGFAVGDALGVPAEFKTREELKLNPVTDMLQLDDYPAGMWSDDTSMTLCTLASFKENDWKLDCDDIMNRFVKWLNEGYMTATGEVFDVGITTRKAILRYYNGISLNECAPQNEWSCGNGSLMRILPVVFYLMKNQETDMYEVIKQISGMTHKHNRCIIGCYIYCCIAETIINGRNDDIKELLICGAEKAFNDLNLYHSKDELEVYGRIFEKNLYTEPVSNIKSSGYVVDTLEVVLWCLWNTGSYKECMLLAVNLGDDADTVAAVAGGLAGLYYGIGDIPKNWLEKLENKELIESVC